MKSAFLPILASILMGTTALAQDNRVLTFGEAKQMADQGNAYGEAVVAFHYSVGWQTEKNLELAAKYATSSARKGHPLGIFRLGVLSRAGEGIERNEDQGLALQKRAFAGLNKMQGNPYAITALGEMLAEGKVLPENKKDAARLFKKAADIGFAPAQFNYAMCAQAGHGIPKDQEICDNYVVNAKSKEYPPALDWIVSNFKHISLDELNSIQGSYERKALEPVVQELPNGIWSVDVSKNMRLIAVQTGTHVFIYESGSGRLLSSFKSIATDISFRDGSDTLIVQINRHSKQVQILDISTGQTKPINFKTKGTPLAYSPHDDSLVFLSLSKNGKLDGEVYKINLSNSKLVSMGHIKSSANVCGDGYYDLHVLASNDGRLAIVNFYNDAWEGFKPINCFLEYINGEWVASYNDKAVSEVINFLQLPKPEKKLSSDHNGRHYKFRQTTFPLDKMLWLSGKPHIILLDDSPKNVSIATPKGWLNRTIITPSARKADGITASLDGRKLLLWNIDESWVKSNLASDWKNFSFNGQKQAMGLPPALADFSEFTYSDIPIANYIIWSSMLRNDGRKAAFIVSNKRKQTPHFGSGSSLLERRALSNALLFDLTNNIIVESNNSAEFCPFDMMDSEGSISIGDKVSIDFANSHFASISSQWSIEKDEKIKFASNHQSNPTDKLFVKNSKIRNSISVKNFTAWNLDSEYSFSSIVTMVEEDNVNSTRLFFDDDVESAFPIEAGRYLIHTSNFILIYDTINKKISSTLHTGNLDGRLKNIALCSEANHFWYQDPSGFSIRRVNWDAKGQLSETLRMYPQLHGHPLYLLPDGYYASKGSGSLGLHFSDRKKTFPFEQFDLRLNRPEIVLERLGAPEEALAIAKQLREKRLKRMGVTEDMLQPDFHLPEIEIVGDLPSSTAESELALKIKASDSKYPLDRLRLYVNNVPVNGKEGELLRDAISQSLERTIPIKLAAGRNKIQVSVLNSAGAESLYANAEVTCTAQRPKPTLYAVAMGVSEYANPEWNLKYAAKDAQDILERLKARSGSSYGEIKELLLTDREATKESLGKIREFLSTATVNDTVLLFVAGHGLLDSKYDYYFGTSDIDFNNPSGNGIAFEEFDDLLAELPSLRKSLLIDTCHAGELDEDEKKMLASAQANSNQVVAMLPAGARGMTIKPIEGARGKSEWYDRLQGLFVDLRRGSGSTILSSSAGAEYALESSEQKNGLFTYAVLEALDGKEGSDANKDGSVTMTELADYVKTRVATLTNNKQSPNVRRVNLESDFALSKK